MFTDQKLFTRAIWSMENAKSVHRTFPIFYLTHILYIFETSLMQSYVSFRDMGYTSTNHAIVMKGAGRMTVPGDTESRYSPRAIGMKECMPTTNGMAGASTLGPMEINMLVSGFKA
jgi:hypothetical protein